MRFHYFLSLLLIPFLILSLGCEDATVTSGQVRLASPSDFSGVTAITNTRVGIKKYGYSELKFEVTGSTDNLRALGLLVRAQDASNLYACMYAQGITPPSSMLYIMPIADSNPETGVYVDLGSVLSNGEYTLGCEVVADGSNDKINAYFNGTLVVSYTIGSGGETVYPEGKFGIAGASENDEIGIKSFTFLDQKP